MNWAMQHMRQAEAVSCGLVCVYTSTLSRFGTPQLASCSGIFPALATSLHCYRKINEVSAILLLHGFSPCNLMIMIFILHNNAPEELQRSLTRYIQQAWVHWITLHSQKWNWNWKGTVLTRLRAPKKWRLFCKKSSQKLWGTRKCMLAIALKFGEGARLLINIFWPILWCLIALFQELVEQTVYLPKI